MQNVLCNAGNNGTITVNASNGVGTLSYQLNSGTPQASNVFTNLTAGTYTVTVRDGNNCSNQKSVTITQPAVLASSEDAVNVLCNGGNNGKITVTATGGTAPYQYRIGTGALQTSNEFTNLSAGTFNISIVDANNCTVTRSVTITQPAAVTNSPSMEEAKCFGEASGRITVTAAGGVAPYQYRLGTGTLQSNPLFTGLAAGSYAVVVRDANGCETTQNITVTQRPQLIAAVTAVNPDASNRFVGSVKVVGTGGTGPYEYSLNGAPYQTSGDFASGYVIGQNTISVRDANGCIATSNKLIELNVTPDTWKSFTKLYPNPNNGVFYIDIRGVQADQSFQLQVFDAKGRMVYSALTGTSNTGSFIKQLNLGNLGRGIHTMKVTSSKNGQQIILRFVVNQK